MIASFTDTGKGKQTIVFLHGLGLNRNIWNAVISELSSQFRCISIDLPGHGKSSDITTDGRMSSYVAEVRKVIEHLSLKNFIVCGHSMGGQIGIILSLQLSASVERLILIAAAGIETFTPAEALKLKAATQHIYRNPISTEALKHVFPLVNNEKLDVLINEHLVQQQRNFERFSSLIYNSVCGMLDEPVFNYLPHLTMPVHVLYGTNDTAIPNRILHPQQTVTQIAKDAAARIPNCTTQIVQGCGHYLPVENPTIVAGTIKNLV
ncbi:MAG: alpha/beta hydrolase [Bacteroidia bacterium]|nr:alpha/beta hydrolase [Bacteroidia bacterium]